MSLIQTGNELLPDKNTSVKSPQTSFFENLPAFLTTAEVVALTRAKRATVFDWHYRPYKYKCPEDLFHKVGRRLLVRRDVLLTWFFSRTS